MRVVSLRGGFASSCLKAGTACCMKASIWPEDVEDEAACVEGFWSGALDSALPALQSLVRCSTIQRLLSTVPP